MLGEPVLRKHARIPADDGLIRFLVIAPERTELVRYKLARSPLLRAALDAGTWHIVKANHLRTFLARDPLDLADLEPYLGLDPMVERSAEQMALFGGCLGRLCSATRATLRVTAAHRAPRSGALHRRPTA